MAVFRKIWDIIKKSGPISSVVLFFLLVYAIPHTYKHRHEFGEPNCARYEYLGDDVDCEESSKEELERMINAEEQVLKIIERYKKERGLQKASVFVRDLESRHWFAIEPDEHYIPASLLKAFVMASYLRFSLIDEGILDNQIVYDGSFLDLNSVDELIPPERKLIKGQAYSVRDLIQFMIRDSSNTATKILVDNINSNFLASVYKDFGVIVPDVEKKEDILGMEFISTRSFANLSRALYNGNYLTPENSNLALEFLSQTSFKDGIVAGVPEGTIVAHKFGHRKMIIDNNKTENTLSDCGIVYAPWHDYSICVMAKGGDLKSLESLIKEVSALSYAELDKKRD